MFTLRKYVNRFVNNMLRIDKHDCAPRLVARNEINLLLIANSIKDNL
jgi:hypothetical protein